MPLPGPPVAHMFNSNTIEEDTYEVAYNVVEGSPEGNFYYDRGMVPMTIHVGHEQVDTAILVFMGKCWVYTNPVAVGGKNYRTIKRAIPHRLPNRQWMVCQGVSQIKPLGMRSTYDTYPSSAADPIPNYRICNGNRLDGTGLPIYEMAEIALQYVFPIFKVKADSEVINPLVGHGLEGLPDEAYWIGQSYAESRYVSRIIKRQTKILTFPRGMMRRGDTKQLILEAIPVSENVATFEYTWFQVPEEALPELAWLAGSNCVNEFMFDGRPKGTLLFTGEPEVREEPNPITGQHLYSVKYVFHSLTIPDPDPAIPVGSPDKVKGHNYIRVVHENKLKVVRFETFNGDIAYKDFDFTNFFRPDPLDAP